MSNEVSTLKTSNFAMQAAASGVDTTNLSDATSIDMYRLKVSQSAVMGIEEIKNKKVKVEIVSAGAMSLQHFNGGEVFLSEDVTIRPYMQRLSYQRYVPPTSAGGRMIKTFMALNLKGDLKDTDGGFNCGRPSGYIEDWNALPADIREIYKAVRRVRTVLGTVSMRNVITNAGKEVEDIIDLPFSFDITARDTFKAMQAPFEDAVRKQHLPLEHSFNVTVQEQAMNNGDVFYFALPTPLADEVLPIDPEVEATFGAFVEYVARHNDYVSQKWSEANAADEAEDYDEDAAELVDDIVEVG